MLSVGCCRFGSGIFTDVVLGCCRRGILIPSTIGGVPGIPK